MPNGTQNGNDICILALPKDVPLDLEGQQNNMLQNWDHQNSTCFPVIPLQTVQQS
jgi:hypothetical protein